jgi:hypothetical protein
MYGPDRMLGLRGRKLKSDARSMQKARKSGRIEWLNMKDKSQDQNPTYFEKAESDDELTDQELEDRSRNLRGTTTLAHRGQSSE